MTDSATLDSMADTWAKSYGLVRDRTYAGQTSFHPLFTSKQLALVERESQAHFGDSLLDHSRAFKSTGGARSSVFVSAPYEGSVLRAIGNAGRVVEEIWDLAEVLKLRVRVGNPGDVIYEGGSPSIAILPIVWWDPARVALPYAGSH